MQKKKTPPPTKPNIFPLNSDYGKVMTTFEIDLPIQFFYRFSSHSFGRDGGVGCV